MRSRRHTLEIVATCAVVALLAGLHPNEAAGATSPSSSTVADAASERAVYGLRSDEAFVSALVGSTADVGSGLYGIAATQSELDALDLPGRADLVSRAQEKILPVATSLPGYAGSYQDQARGGRLVVRFTSIGKQSKAALAALTEGLAVDVIEGASATYNALDDALSVAWRRFSTIVPSGRLITVGVDEAANRLVLGVSSDTIAAAQASLDKIRSTLGVPVSVEIAPDTVLATCTARDTCYDPMRAGSYLRNNLCCNPPRYQQCTMGFHVYLSSGYGFLSAGHCSYDENGDYWYMDGWPAPSGGFIGTVQRTAYKDLGQDVMVVSMNTPAQRSNLIYATGRTVHGRANPVAGETMCASLGFSNVIDCGTVRTVNFSWVDDNNFIIRGGDADGIAVNLGDSGSPLWRNSGTSSAVATGVVDTTQGYFAKMGDALAALGVSIYP